MLASLRLELRALLELYLIPGLSALMPWSLGFRWLRFCSRFSWLYRQEWQAALAQARQYVPIPDEALWARQFRLSRLMDHADMYLSRTRSDRWMRRYAPGFDVWPGFDGTPVCMPFHWNQGFWLLRAMRARGARVSSLSAPLARRTMGGAYLAWLYGALRLREVIRINGAPLIFAEGAARPALRALKAGTWLCGLPDVPLGLRESGRPVVLFGREATFSNGVLGIARLAKAPVILMSQAVDMGNGHRRIRISQLDDPQGQDALQRLASHWEGLLREHSVGYSLWPAFPAWFATGDTHPPVPPAGPNLTGDMA